MRYALSIFLLFFLLPALQAQPTQLTVRAKAKDAKFIGTSIGGAMIIVRDALTDEILARGRTEGSNGIKLGTYPMQITETANVFAGPVPTDEGGTYEFIVTAFDPRTGNTGVDKVNFVVEKD